VGGDRVRGVLQFNPPLMPTFHKAFKEVGIVPILILIYCESAHPSLLPPGEKVKIKKTRNEFVIQST
jgi:hypothetical protein